MADSLLNLDPVAPIFDFNIDWETEPTKSIEPQIISNIYSGTIHSIHFFNDPKQKFKYKISDYTTKLYPFLIFFADRVGRYKNFWMPDQAERFTLRAIAGDFLSIEINKISDLYLHGHERLFLRMSNGDRISRKILAANQLTSTTQLTFSLALPEETTLENIEFASLLYLVRFESDEIEITYDGNIPSVDLSFVELLEEYDSSGV